MAAKRKQPKSAVTQIQAWSYSRYNVHAQCPYKAQQQIIHKRYAPENPGMKRGNALHKIAEDYLTGRRKDLTEDFDDFLVEYEALKNFGPIVEEEWAWLEG